MSMYDHGVDVPWGMCTKHSAVVVVVISSEVSSGRPPDETSRHTQTGKPMYYVSTILPGCFLAAPGRRKSITESWW